MEKPTILTAWTFILDNGSVLLYERKNTWYENGNYGLPGGLVDQGETPEEAAAREVNEETALNVDHTALELLRLEPFEYPEKLYKNHYFLAKDWSGTPVNTEPDRCADLSWFPTGGLPENMIAIVRDIIETKL